MAVPVVIDGYNLLYARGEAPSAESRERLVREVVQWARARGRRAVIVFDAWAGGERREREEPRGPVTVCFTRYGERADDRIIRWVSTRPEAVVVTSDREVRRAVSRRGAAVLGSIAFAERLDTALAAANAGPPREEADDEPRPGRRLGRHATWLRGL